MIPSSPIKTLFLDIGGVLLTNGWDHNIRTRAAEKFGLDYNEMIELIRELKARYGLQVAAVSNEGRELTMYRVQQFNLGAVIEFFISSCFVHYRKPDVDMYRIALDIAQVSPEQVVYIDDRAMFVKVARGLGIRGIIHTGYEATRTALEVLGLS